MAYRNQGARGPTRPAPERLGPYELVESLATGGMAEVYLARRQGPHGFQKLFAVKRILPQLAKEPDFHDMFVDEARLSARLSHPNIVHVFDFGEDQGELYMAMEYVHGASCARLLRAARSAGQPLGLGVSLYIARSVLRALDYAHQLSGPDGKPLQLVHRDVSPGNVLLHESGAVKLADFGIARAALIERRTDVGQLKGKLGYMSPEQVDGQTLDRRSDLFTLAIVLSELLTGCALFTGPKELDVLMRIRDADLSVLEGSRDSLPGDVYEVLERALAREPAARFRTAGEFDDALARIVESHALLAGPESLATTLRSLGLVSADPEGPARAAPLSTVPASLRPTRHDLDEQAALQELWRLQQRGVVEGPMPFPALVELFATGRIAHDAQVSREGGEFLPPHRFPELARFATSPALVWEESMPVGTLDREHLSRQLLPSRVFYLASRRETGALLLQHGERRKRVYFVRGVPDYVASTDKSELLGESLVRRGRILRMELDMAVAMLPKFGGKLGDALVGLGVLRPMDLFRALHEQLQERLVEVFAWTQGEVAFLPGERSQEESLPFNVDPYEILARGIRQHYEADELRGRLAFLADQELCPQQLSARIQSFRLEPAEEKVLRAIEQPVLLAELERRLVPEVGRTTLLQTVFFGLSAGVLEAPGFSSFTPMRGAR